MSVRELRELLLNFDQDLPVRMYDREWNSLEDVDSVYVQGLDHGVKVVILDT